MPIHDQHLHSLHSFDSQASPDENVERAIELGLDGLTFTEHFDTHPDDAPTCIYDDAAYTATIARLREKYAGAIWIGKGVEVCYQPPQMDRTVDFLRRHSFDLVLVSVHYMQGRAVHIPEYLQGRSCSELTRDYLLAVRDAMRDCARLHRLHGRLFDVLAHPDFIKRYTHRFLGEVAVDECGAELDDAFTAALEADIVPEINTSTLRQGLDAPMPSVSAVGRYARLGGQAMSLGSDAHRSSDVGGHFPVAASMLREAGLRFAAFRQRQREFVDVRMPSPGR